MKLTKIDGLQCLVCFDGRIYGYVDDVTSHASLELRVGTVDIPFEDTTFSPLANGSMLQDFVYDTTLAAQRASSEPAQTPESAVFACWISEFKDWALSGKQTIQLMIVDKDRTCEIRFDNPIAVHATGQPLYFLARIACHRANARLKITFSDTETDARVEESVVFDPSFRGGQTTHGYQDVCLRVPKQMAQCEVELGVSYEGYIDDGTGVEPFMFLADVLVSSDVSRNSALVIPEILAGSGAVRKGHWVSAPLPVNSLYGHASLQVRAGNQSIGLSLEPGAQLELVENYGHSICARSDKEIETLLCIDGEPVARQTIGEKSTFLRVPVKYLNGTTRHISLKDKTASITLIETLCLLPCVFTPADVLQRETSEPFPLSVFAQTPLRYEALKAALTHADDSSDLPQLAHTVSVLEAGYEKVRLAPLSFPEVAKPDVSIIIPAHNKVEVTYLALCSLLLAHNKASFEVIVVDDASTDETAELENIVSGITVIHNAEPQRFIRACNAGAEKARGDYIVLLNNDVEVTIGWLDELIAAFARFDNVGLAGSKLIYPTGELQDAGGIIWGSGNPWNYGNKQNPQEPRFSYARQCDYLSGAAMMVPAKVWQQVGGLSSYLEPMYFEDTDFAFKVRDAGYSTWFVPSSVVYHYEGMTSGTDVTTGYKKYQEVNRPKFKRRWAKAYANFGKEGQAPDLEKDRGIAGRVLFIDYTTPRGDQDAGSYAALQEIKLVQSLGYKVTFLPTNMAHLGRYTEDLQKAGVEVIYAPFFATPAEYIEKHGADFDALYLTRYYVAHEVLDRIRSFAPQAKVLFNNADLHFLRELRSAKSEVDADLLEKARRTRDAELEVINKVDVVLSYNDIEHSVIQAYTDGQATVLKCPWVVDTPDDIPEFDARAGLSFLGGFNHHPNRDGIKWFAREIMPRIIQKAGALTLSIYGSKMDDDIRALKTEFIAPVGFVENIADAYNRHRVFVAPLRSGAGIKGKVLSAMAHGIPCVLTPTAAEGIGLRSGHDCFVVDKPEDWAEAIEKLNRDKELWTTISQNARTYMRDSYSFERGRDLMRAAFEAADMFQSFD